MGPAASQEGTHPVDEEADIATANNNNNNNNDDNNNDDDIDDNINTEIKEMSWRGGSRTICVSKFERNTNKSVPLFGGEGGGKLQIAPRTPRGNRWTPVLPFNPSTLQPFVGTATQTAVKISFNLIGSTKLDSTLLLLIKRW